MKTKIMKYKICYILILIVIMFFISGILANITDMLSVVNNLAVDTVDIELTQKMIRNNNLVDFENNDVVLPGQSISFIPNISNAGVDCYVRVKLETDVLSYDDFQSFNEKWKYNPLDDYFYYTEVLNEEKTIEVFQSFTIPDSWSNEMADESFIVNMTAEAIQSRNFYPNFDSNDPWNGEKAEKTVRARLDRKLVKLDV